MPTKKRRQSRSKRKRGTRRVGGGTPRSSARSSSSRSSSSLPRTDKIDILSHCDKNMFKKYNTPQYLSALNTIIHELLKYNPLAIIDFIDKHFNETSILAHFNNEKCIKKQLNTLKRKLSEYKQKIVKTNTETYEEITMETAYSILNKGFAKFSVSELHGGAPVDDSTNEFKPPCAVCLEDLENGRVIIAPIQCPHRGHARCLRRWWRENPSCPECRVSGTLPPPSPEELAEAAEEEAATEAEAAATAAAARLRRIAYVLGVCGFIFYNLEHIMSIVLMMAGDERGVGPRQRVFLFSIILFILSTLGII